MTASDSWNLCSVLRINDLSASLIHDFSPEVVLL